MITVRCTQMTKPTNIYLYVEILHSSKTIKSKEFSQTQNLHQFVTIEKNEFARNASDLIIAHG